METYRQMEFFPSDQHDQAPSSVMWNLWHGCTKVSPGCLHCYVYRRDAMHGKDTTIVQKTASFRLPVRKIRSGEFRGCYKYGPGSVFYTCFTSDFFHPDADAWRPEAWQMMRIRSDCRFYMITKRPERIVQCLPPDWEDGYENVEISCTCENQKMADARLPVFLQIPMRRRSIIHEPLLGPIDIRSYLDAFQGRIQSVSVGGESGPEARICDYSWVLDIRQQCIDHQIPFHYHQTGAKLRKEGKLYDIPRKYQNSQARKAGIDIDTF